jgi:hypothetical protein
VISLLSSAAYHLNGNGHYGSLVTANGWSYIAIAMVVLACLVFIGDRRYAARQQEIEGQERPRSAQARIADVLAAGTSADEIGTCPTGLNRPADDGLTLSALWDLTNAQLGEYHR